VFLLCVVLPRAVLDLNVRRERGGVAMKRRRWDSSLLAIIYHSLLSAARRSPRRGRLWGVLIGLASIALFGLATIVALIAGLVFGH